MDRPEIEAVRSALEPFVRTARGIPHNWPGRCVLNFDEYPSGTRALSYLKEDDRDWSPTIADWRRLLDAADSLDRELADWPETQTEAGRQRAEFERHAGAARELYAAIYRLAAEAGGTFPEGCSPLGAVESLAERIARLKANLEAVVSHWNEFGCEADLDVPMDQAWRYLNGLPPAQYETDR